MNDATPGRPLQIRASVCMATYRGSQYVEEQLASILRELGPDDELIVVDDASPDETAAIVGRVKDARVRLVVAPHNRGYVRTFEEAIKLSRGQFIFLSDQDDVWIEGRLAVMMGALESAQVVASNFEILGGGPRPWIPKLRSSDSRRNLANLWGILIGYRAYYGCAMGFRRDAMGLVVPIPSFVRESHDLWLAICGNMARSVAHLDGATVFRRLHGENQTPAGWRSLRKIAAARIMLLRLMFEAFRRSRRAVSSDAG
ncbi:glycosyltransferase [Pseudarthrobacter sp. L1SW]|uniref:glycosyltransferase n=1 Tax=Pseudarthrobacter sp. L1SW TaxID=2851598 RepID=UPI001E2D71EB|nr:glycosyltransferase [Pseudarthrobacter sp. L1SW]UEL27357.1 glycosyltransferase [Pseudarthrobacter sp. L1SW]